MIYFTEGFDQQRKAVFPKSEGTSTVSNAMPGSTTSNSKKSLATFKDLGALLESMNTYKALYEKNIINASKNKEYSLLNSETIKQQKRIQAQIDTGTVIDTNNVIKKLQNKYINAISKLKQNNIPNNKPNKPNNIPTVKAVLNDELSLKDLSNTIERAKEEKDRLDALRSSSPMVKKRTIILDKIISDLHDLISKITRGELNINKLPFSKREITRFLEEIKSKDGQINPLIPINKEKNKSKSQILKLSPNQKRDKSKTDNKTELLNDLRRSLKDISWDFHIGYDPKVTFQRKMMEKVAKISKEIDSGTLTDNQIKAKMLELKVLKQQCSTDNRRLLTSTNNKLKAYNTIENLDEPYQSTLEEFSNGYPINQPLIKTIKPASSSTEWQTRPGYSMTDENISKRAVAASFDYSKVGGPDYFKRAHFLCNQIRDAGLGDPKEFGCIDSEMVVSPEYSWKGNYIMVCSRLGTVWGGWYPEMFGCPKADDSIRQVPNIKFNP